MSSQKNSIIAIPKQLLNTTQLLKIEPIYFQLVRCTKFLQIEKQKQIQQKINHLISKQKYIHQLQNQFEQKLRYKNDQILRKINKSIQTKKQNMDKIKQKCHLRQIYQNQKIKQHKKRQKNQRNQQWKQSKKLSQGINIKSIQQNKIKSISNSRIKKQMLSTHKMEKKKQIKTLTLPRYSTINNVKRQNQDFANISKQKHFETTKSQRNQKLENDNYRALSYVEKMKEVKQYQEKQQIQRYNQKLQKLQQARMKKQKIQMEKQKKIHSFMESKKNKLDQSFKNKNNNNKQRIRSKTQLNTQPNNQDIVNHTISQKNSKFKQWQNNNKKRNLKLFQLRLQKGEIYMNLMKDKSLRNKKVKQIEMISIQKKLYLERIRIHQLSQRKYHN